MTLNEAMVYLSDCMSETERILYPEILKAHMLGSEALRREKMRRKFPTLHWDKLLPGETEE